MNCTKCGKTSAHSILIRKGDLPADPFDPKFKVQDKSGMYIVPFCADHWRELEEFLTVHDATEFRLNHLRTKTDEELIEIRDQEQTVPLDKTFSDLAKKVLAERQVLRQS